MNFQHMPELQWEYGYFYGLTVIVLSGSTDPEAHVAVRIRGADAFLSKPVDVDELLGTLLKTPFAAAALLRKERLVLTRATSSNIKRT